ncbi:hypothetical protein [Marinobacter sp.]|uniref:hypothetical protein n=1 Tax=Marinobacter sp. TaxID=50741 RepID=UPI002B27409B|nr:hypothetical protein [Marinobacter sp.]
MIKNIAGLVLVVSSGFVCADEGRNVSSLMEKYLSTVTCATYESEKDLRIFELVKHGNDVQAFGVLWTGDKSCGGGSGAGNVYVTPVVATRWGELVVASEGEFKVSSREYNAAYFHEDETLILNVPKYQEGDPNCCPSGSETHLLKYDEINQKIIGVEAK